MGAQPESLAVSIYFAFPRRCVTDKGKLAMRGVPFLPIDAYSKTILNGTRNLSDNLND